MEVPQISIMQCHGMVLNVVTPSLVDIDPPHSKRQHWLTNPYFCFVFIILGKIIGRQSI